MSHRIRVLCVDDHPIVRDGISLLVSRQRDMELVAAVGSGEEGVAAFQFERPDVTLMDLHLPAMSGLEAIRAIRVMDTRALIIVLTMYEGDEDIRRAIESGAATYVLKTTLTDQLVRVMREATAGHVALAPEMAARLRQPVALARLTPREVQVMELVAAGQRNKEIAASLRISEDTVESHMKNVLTKLRVQDRSAAVKVAMQRGFIHLS